MHEHPLLTPDAFDATSRLWRPRLVRASLAWVAVAADAEDIAQQTLLRAWEHRGGFDASKPVGPWLLTIARRLAADRRRALGRRRRHEAAACAVARSDAADPAGAGSAAQDEFWEAVADVLTGDRWSMVWLVYHDGLTVGEAGRVIGRRAGAARTLLHRARLELADRLEDL